MDGWMDGWMDGTIPPCVRDALSLLGVDSMLVCLTYACTYVCEHVSPTTHTHNHTHTRNHHHHQALRSQGWQVACVLGHSKGAHIVLRYASLHGDVPKVNKRGVLLCVLPPPPPTLPPSLPPIHASNTHTLSLLNTLKHT